MVAGACVPCNCFQLWTAMVCIHLPSTALERGGTACWSWAWSAPDPAQPVAAFQLQSSPCTQDKTHRTFDTVLILLSTAHSTAPVQLTLRASAALSFLPATCSALLLVGILLAPAPLPADSVLPVAAVWLLLTGCIVMLAVTVATTLHIN